MVRHNLSAPTSRNRLLAALPPGDFARLWPLLERVELPLHHILDVPNQPIAAVHFPETGWVSMLAYLDGRDAVEVALVGREGMVGLPLLLDADRSSLEAMVQAPGTALRLGAGAFRDALGTSLALRALLSRYALAHHEQVARTAACNARHRIEERLARWLLMAHDRAAGDKLPITNESVSMMLGVRRTGIAVATGMLTTAGLIRCDRGYVVVIDRPGLEAAACDCYGTVQRSFKLLLDPISGTEAEAAILSKTATTNPLWAAEASSWPEFRAG
jgi:CRP-like cAMP-binding protein